MDKCKILITILIIMIFGHDKPYIIVIIVIIIINNYKYFISKGHSFDIKPGPLVRPSNGSYLYFQVVLIHLLLYLTQV